MNRTYPDPVPNTESAVLGRRVAATVIDLIIYWVVAISLIVGGFYLAEVAAPFIFLLFLLLPWTAVWYLMEGWNGQTPGKALTGIVVVSDDGSPCTMKKSFIRNILWIADAEPFAPIIMLAYIAFFTDQNQRVGDMVANTVVVKAAPAGSMTTEWDTDSQPPAAETDSGWDDHSSTSTASETSWESTTDDGWGSATDNGWESATDNEIDSNTDTDDSSWGRSGKR